MKLKPHLRRLPAKVPPGTIVVLLRRAPYCSYRPGAVGEWMSHPDDDYPTIEIGCGRWGVPKEYLLGCA